MFIINCCCTGISMLFNDNVCLTSISCLSTVKESLNNPTGKHFTTTHNTRFFVFWTASTAVQNIWDTHFWKTQHASYGLKLSIFKGLYTQYIQRIDVVTHCNSKDNLSNVFYKLHVGLVSLMELQKKYICVYFWDMIKYILLKLGQLKMSWVANGYGLAVLLRYLLYGLRNVTLFSVILTKNWFQQFVQVSNRSTLCRVVSYS